jgi:hypothetical protein
MANNVKILAGLAIVCIVLAVVMGMAGGHLQAVKVGAGLIQSLGIGLVAGAVIMLASKPETFKQDQCIPVPVWDAVANYGSDIRFGCGDDNCKIVLPGSPHSGELYPSTIKGCLDCTSECPNMS